MALLGVAFLVPFSSFWVVVELQDKKKENLEASILVHRRYRNVIQRIRAYRWQQHGGREDQLEGWQEGREDQWEREDRQDLEAPHQEKEL